MCDPHRGVAGIPIATSSRGDPGSAKGACAAAATDRAGWGSGGSSRRRGDRGRVIAISLLLTGLGLAAGGCWPTGSPEPGGPAGPAGDRIRVVCTTTIVADMVRHVGGERVEVQTLMGPGVDPHRYIAGIADLRRLQAADLIFTNGLHLEGKMADLLARSRQRVVALAETVPPHQLLPAAEDGTVYDPHIWFDVRLWAATAPAVAEVLAQADPDGAADYRQRADNYRQQLEELDTAIRQELQQVPPPRRVLITAHDAFRYFGRAYGFEVVGLQGVSTASELGTQQRDRLAELIVRRQIPAVFTETSVPSEGLAAVLDDVRRKGGPAVRLISGEKALYSDALGPPDSPAGTYIGMIRHNVRVIVEALGP